MDTYIVSLSRQSVSGRDLSISNCFGEAIHSSNCEVRTVLLGASDGRVAVWSMRSGSPLWGFRGLSSLEDLDPQDQADQSRARWGSVMA